MAERSRDARAVSWLHDFIQDATYGVRTLGASPGVACAAVISLAVGIGANTAVGGAINATFVRTLPCPDADRLVRITTYSLDNPGQTAGGTRLEYRAWKERSGTIEALGASASGPRDISDPSADAPVERVQGQAFTPALFAMLGVWPQQGALPSESADPFSTSARVVIISHRLWQRMFAGASDVLGREIRVDRALRRVIGIMPPDFRYQDDNVDCWIPLLFAPAGDDRVPATRRLAVTARLTPGVSVAQVQADLGAISAQVARELPEGETRRGVRITPLRDAMYGWTRPLLLTLQAAVALVLIVACANVAGLLLARGSARQREMAIRISLGAGRGRMVQQLLTESVLLASAGGALGLVVAMWAAHGLRSALGPPPGVPRPMDLHVDGGVLAVAALLSVATAALVGLVPALTGSRLDLVGALNASAPSVGADRRKRRERSALVAAQISLAVVLLVGAGLLVTSFLRLARRDVNVDPRGLLTFDYDTNPTPWLRTIAQPDGTRALEIDPRMPLGLERVYERLTSIPGVTSVAGISFPPVNSLTVPRVTARVTSGRPAETAAYFVVTPGYFAAMRTPLVGGREFDARDTARARAVAVINEAAARRLWPDADPIGRLLTLEIGPGEEPREVIGIVRDVPVVRRQLAPEPIVYTSYRQPPARYTGQWGSMFARMTFILRSPGDPLALVPAVRRAVAEIDAVHPIVEIGTVERHLEARMPEARDYVVALTALALTATLLAALGVYGVTAYSVSRRTREIGIRKALGVVRLVAGRVLALASIGAAVGLAGAMALTSLIQAQLWGIHRTDPATYAGAALLIVAVALAACLVPVRRAMSVDPVIALRRE